MDKDIHKGIHKTIKNIILLIWSQRLMKNI